MRKRMSIRAIRCICTGCERGLGVWVGSVSCVNTYIHIYVYICYVYIYVYIGCLHIHSKVRF